ncbi:MAG: acyltransferase [Anaerolineales bacterium]|nr:acyltransferase [Anaerolineales bacterium]
MQGPILRLAIFLVYQTGYIESFRDPVFLPIYTLPFSYIDAFALGAYITRFSVPNARKQLTYLSLVIPLLGFATQFAANGNFEPFLTLGYQDSLPDAYQFLWAYTLLNYWFAVLIYCVVHEKLFVRFLDWVPLQYLGKISYGLYIYHFPIVYFFPVNWFVDQIQQTGISEDFVPLLILISYFVCTVTIASLSYYVLEKPFLRMKERFVSYSI